MTCVIFILFHLEIPGLIAIESNRLPSYFDPVASLNTRGTRFTCASGPIAALAEAMEPYATEEGRRARFEHYQTVGQYLRRRLTDLGIDPLAHERWAAPVMTTFTPPRGESTPRFVSQCRRWGFEVAGMSRYRASRRWGQITTMGQTSVETIAPLLEHLGRWIEHGPGRAAPR